MAKSKAYDRSGSTYRIKMYDWLNDSQKEWLTRALTGEPFATKGEAYCYAVSIPQENTLPRRNAAIFKLINPRKWDKIIPLILRTLADGKDSEIVSLALAAIDKYVNDYLYCKAHLLVLADACEEKPDITYQGLGKSLREGVEVASKSSLQVTDKLILRV